MSQQTLHEQLSLLQRHFTVVPVDVLHERVSAGQSLRGLAAVTFDDGYRSVLTRGLEVLNDLGMPATWFVSGSLVRDGEFWRDTLRFIINSGFSPDFLGFARTIHPAFNRMEPNTLYGATKDPMTVRSSTVDETMRRYLAARGLKEEFEKAREHLYANEADLLAAAGNANLHLGNHSWRHYVLSTLGPHELREDVEACAQLLATMPYPRSRLFSIPFGGAGSYTEETLRVVRDAGYEGVVLSSAGRAASAAAQGGNLLRFMPSEGNLWFLFGNSP